MPVPRTFAILLMLVTLPMSPTFGFERPQLYDRPVLEAEISRYNQLIEQLYRNHFQPHLTQHQRARLDSVEYRLPLPRPEDDLVDFTVTYNRGRPLVVMPVASLKLLEDLSTAFAWVWSNDFRFDTIDLYLAMLKHKSGPAFSAGRYPDPLQALNVPQNALETRRVDEMSLRLRNSGLAFILAEALGQIVKERPHTGPHTLAQMHARQMEVDRFALDLLERARIIPMGVVVYLHARTFAVSDDRRIVPVTSEKTQSASHPYHSPDANRLIAMAQTIANQSARESDPKRRESFLALAERLTWIASVGTDADLQRCLQAFARSSTADALVLTPDTPGSSALRWCR